MPGFVILRKLERVLRDLDFVQVDLYAICRDQPLYESVREAMRRRWQKITSLVRIDCQRQPRLPSPKQVR